MKISWKKQNIKNPIQVEFKDYFLVRLQQLMLDAQLSSNHLCLANPGFRLDARIDHRKHIYLQGYFNGEKTLHANVYPCLRPK